MTTKINIAKLVKEKVEEAHKEIKVINIVVAGRTGVGKSTLINEIFQGKMADTGQGKPITKTTREITKKGIPLRIWDTRGLEMEDYNNTAEELENLVKQKNSDTNPENHLHIAWLCISEDGRRVEDAEIKLHETLSRHMPVVGVITKSRSDNGFKNEVQKLLPNAKNVIRIRALKETLDDGHQLPRMGLKELVDLSLELIPDAFQNAFVAAQKASLEQKIKYSRYIINTAIGAAGLTGGMPIPMSDAPIIVIEQIGMLAGISAVWGLDLNKSFLSTLIGSLVGCAGATVLGKTIVANLLKLIPGAGTILGGAISSATAISLTKSLGEIYLKTLKILFKEDDGNRPTPKEIVNKFNKLLLNQK
jgi:small GTP-binding protein